MNNSHILLGTNLGNKIANLNKALQLITSAGIKIKKNSPVYQTKAWGNINQDDFYNAVLLVDTSLSATDLLKTVLEIEIRMGRVRGDEKWMPRLIDIDILYYNEEVVQMDNLIIPHPFIAERKFTLIPLNDISPDYMHPLLKSSNSNLLENCKDNSEVMRTTVELTINNSDLV